MSSFTNPNLIKEVKLQFIAGLLAADLGFKHASSAMRMEKETFKLTLARFFELCDLCKFDPAKVIKDIRKELSSRN